MPPRKTKPKPSIWDVGRETPAQVERDAEQKAEDEADASTFPDLERIKAQALQFGEGPRGFLLWMDSKFVEQGQSALSPWWVFALLTLFASEKTWGLFMVGRGGGKSTTLVRVAILYVLFGCLLAERKVPPGQRWIWPFISANTADAGRRIREIEALLRALGQHNVKSKLLHGAPTIELVDALGNEVSFVSIAATIAGVSGPSATGATIDEEAKLRDRAANVNPSTEILTSCAQMFRARPGVKGIRCSSAWREAGSHYAAIIEGDTDTTHVARIGAGFLDIAVSGLLEVAAWEDGKGNRDAAQHIRAYAATLAADSPNVPTWVANPTISALASRMQVESTPVDKTEGNTPRWRIWLRENASLPMTIEEGADAPAASCLGLADENRAVNDRFRDVTGDPWSGSKLWDTVRSDDPRSSRNRGGFNGGGGGRSLL